ncbi:MAG TPA: ABC transporter permease [Terriglobales bacterium]|nr:ABC transporter permease [Terriglobales bacterium]
MNSLTRDIKSGWRVLWKNPALSLIAILSLALAIGANTAIFTVYNAVLLHTVPVSDPSTVVQLFTQDKGANNNLGAGGNFLGVSYLNYLDYAKDTDVFSGLYAVGGVAPAMTYKDETEQIAAQIVTGNYFQVLGVPAAIGRTFTAQETAADGQGALIVFSHEFFERRFGGDRSLIGQLVSLNHHDFMVAGVAPAGFNGTATLGGPEAWVPMSMHDVLLTGPFKAFYNERRPRVFNAFGRLKPGVTLAQADAAVLVTSHQLAQQYPADNRAQSAMVLPLSQTTIAPGQRQQFVLAFSMMLAVVGLVLLIACANVANLLLARGMARQREIAVRLAMGATRNRLVRQLLAESILMALIAGMAGLVLARFFRDLLWAHRPAGLANSTLDLSLDLRVLLFALGISLLTGILFGLAPALRSTRLDLIAQLKERSEPAASGQQAFSLRGLLLIGEVTLSLIALIGAGLFLTSLRNLQKADPGFDAAHIASLRFDLGAAGFDPSKPGAQLLFDQFEKQTLDRVRALPGVASATIASGTPMAASGFARSFLREGETPNPGRASQFVSVESITPGNYFDTMRIPLLSGRDFTPNDSENTQKVMVVNQTMAKQVWPGQDPIGKRLRFTGDTDYTQVVGIARDSKYFTLSENPTPFAYFPLSQYPQTALGLTVRTLGAPSGVLQEMRAAMRAQDRTMPVTQVQVADDPIQQTLWPAQMAAYLLAALALLATILAAVGIYGVMSYAVRQRSRELGIRMAMGAAARDIFAMVIRNGMTLVGVGILAGILGALALGQVISTFLFGMKPADPVTFASYSLLFVLVALIASYFPARRATRVDPVVTLRQE